MQTGAREDGTVIALRGAVVDIRFAAGDALPPIEDGLIIEDEDGQSVLAEVQAHLDDAHGARHRAAGDDRV